MSQTEDNQQSYIGTAALAQRHGSASWTNMRWFNEPQQGPALPSTS